ncbi:hypothetical protein WJX81_002630 [Elliptochloris bilobata]|uniref:Uncharacterized protein n=1 Tax=Elliptochloris bilobata TaxID=381761 RepID=A0AAW1S3Y6_9CHLO
MSHPGPQGYPGQGYPAQQGYGQHAPGGFPPQRAQQGALPGEFAGAMGGALGLDPVMTGFASNVLQQGGRNYLQRGQEFVQQRMGFLTGGALQHHSNVSGDYVQRKLLMLLAPFLRRWSYTRNHEQIAGGHKYLPPRQDVNAPDLYIPFMAACTYCVLASVALTAGKRFKPDTMYATVSEASAAWLVHWVLLKAVLWVLGIPGAVPFLELAAYAGYVFVPVCVSMLAGLALGRWAFRIAWAYGAAMGGVFLVRTLKCVIFHEARRTAIGSKRHNYLLLALWLSQFPFCYYLAVLP